MNDLINTQTQVNSHHNAQLFANNTPFKHIVINDFLTTDFCQELLNEFPQFDKQKAKNESGKVGRKAVHERVLELGPAYRQLNDLIKSQAFIKLIEKITGIDGLIYDPHYYGGGTHNNLHGQDLDPHVDFTHHPKTGHHRRLNLIIYLNHEWQKDWGGNIELHKNPRLEPIEDEIISIEPLFNRAVIFETNNISWHGFPRINLPEDKQGLSRKSFALYYYSKKREEKTTTHSTIYVDRHLPEHIKAGLTLSEQDVQDIKLLLARRDQHLKRLYNTIIQLTSKTAEIKYRLMRKFALLFKNN